jgi:hypothetical protein
MEIEGKQQSSSNSFLKAIFIFLVGAAVVFLTAVVTIYMTKTLHPSFICSSSRSSGSLFSAEPVWDQSEKYEIPGKDLTVVRTSYLCYVTPNEEPSEPGKGVSQEVVGDSLTEAQLEALTGPAGVEICDGLPTYMTKVIIPEHETLNRQRRQARVLNNPAQDVSNYNEAVNENRCMDKVIICDEMVGQTQSCHTGVNGIFYMDITCNSPTEFKTFQTKPPGRLIKIMRDQAVICQKRRQAGLGRC